VRRRAGGTGAAAQAGLQLAYLNDLYSAYIHSDVKPTYAIRQAACGSWASKEGKSEGAGSW
jgi:hypothetical protein